MGRTMMFYGRAVKAFSRRGKGRTMPDVAGQRILVTQAGDFMGPAICRFLAARGAEVVADARAARAGSGA